MRPFASERRSDEGVAGQWLSSHDMPSGGPAAGREWLDVHCECLRVVVREELRRCREVLEPMPSPPSVRSPSTPLAPAPSLQEQGYPAAKAAPDQERPYSPLTVRRPSGSFFPLAEASPGQSPASHVLTLGAPPAASSTRRRKPPLRSAASFLEAETVHSQASPKEVWRHESDGESDDWLPQQLPGSPLDEVPSEEKPSMLRDRIATEDSTMSLSSPLKAERTVAPPGDEDSDQGEGKATKLEDCPSLESIPDDGLQSGAGMRGIFSLPMRAIRQVSSHFAERSAADSELMFEMQVEEMSGCRKLAQKTVMNGTLDCLIFIVILTNSATIGLEVDHEATHVGGEAPPSFYEALEVVFCVMYLAEFSLRAFVLRSRFLMSFGALFDSSLIALQVLEIIAKTIGRTTGESPVENMSMMTTWRCIRLFRALRLLRLVRFFEDLSNLVYLLFASFWAFIWTVLLLLVLTYIVGTFITQIVADHRAGSPQDEDVLSAPYGSISRTTLSLYASILGGVDWQDIMVMLGVVNPLLPIMFAVYVAFATLVLLNLVTGVFVDTAQRLREKDRHKEFHLGLERAIKRTGVAMDQLIGDKEFARLTRHEDMQAFLKEKDLNAESVRNVFCLLREKEGDLSPGRFIDFCLRLQGSGSAIELAKLQLTGDRDREELKQGAEKGAEERKHLVVLHKKAADERAHLQQLFESGARDRKELKQLHEKGVRDRQELKELHARNFEHLVKLDGRLDSMQELLLLHLQPSSRDFARAG